MTMFKYILLSYKKNAVVFPVALSDGIHVLSFYRKIRDELGTIVRCIERTLSSNEMK